MFQTTPPPARDYQRLYRRHRWLLIASLVLGAGAALIFSLLETQIYTGTASISFQDINQQATLVGGSAAQTLETPAELAAKSSRIVNQVSVLRAALTASGSRRTVADLNGDTSAVVDPATNLVTVSVDDHTGSGAAQLANAVAAAAVNAANDQARQQFRADAHALAHEIRLIPNDAANAVTRQNEQANLSRLQSLSVLARPASINQMASIPGSPSSPKTPFNTLIGAVLGLIVGFGIAFAREATDRHVHSSEEVAGELGLPILAEIEEGVMGGAPYLQAERDEGVEMAVASFGVLRRNVELARYGETTRVVAVTSAAPEEGKTTVALSLACAFAAVGRRTVLIEADLRRPVLADRLELPANPGLGEYLAGDAGLEEVSRSVDVRGRGRNGTGPAVTGLVCILAGEPRSDPDELLASSRFRELLTELATSFETVVLDTSPLLPVADTLEILPLVDSYIVCVRSGRSRRKDVIALRQTLSRLPSQPIGGVATGVARRDLAAGGYGYYGGYQTPQKQKPVTTG